MANPTTTRLRRARMRARMRMCELALRARVNYSNLSRWERGWQQPSPDTIEKLADALGCSTSEIVAEEEDPQ